MIRLLTLLAIGILALTSVGCGSKSTRNYETLVTVQAAKPADYGPIGDAMKVFCFALIAVAVIAAACYLARSSNAQKRNDPKLRSPGKYRGRRSRRQRHYRRRSKHYRGRRYSRGRRHQAHSKGRSRHHNRKKLQPNQPVKK
jgi:hypothetical protein